MSGGTPWAGTLRKEGLFGIHSATLSLLKGALLEREGGFSRLPCSDGKRNPFTERAIEILAKSLKGVNL